MRLHQISDELTTAFKILKHKYVRLRNGWNDAVGNYFENQYWQPFEKQFNSTMKQMNELADTIDKAKLAIK